MATTTRDGRMVKAGSSESAKESRQVVHDPLEALAPYCTSWVSAVVISGNRRRLDNSLP